MNSGLTLADRIASRKNKSLVVQTRVDARSVADLALFFREADVVVESKSQIVRLAFELIHELLVDKGKIKEPYETTADALKLLQAVGVRSGIEKRYVGSRLHSQLALEEYYFETGTLPPKTQTKGDPYKGLSGQAKDYAAELGIEMVDFTCSVCEELKSVAPAYLEEHGNVCPRCKMEQADGGESTGIPGPTPDG